MRDTEADAGAIELLGYDRPFSAEVVSERCGSSGHLRLDPRRRAAYAAGMKPTNKPPPIGYILKALDQALTAYTDRALAPHRLTRLHWQVLNAVRDGNGQTLEGIVGILRQFADDAGLKAVVDELVTRGWLQAVAQSFVLTSAGDEGLRLASETQGKVRNQLTHGLSQDDYDAAVRTLEKMLANVSR